MSSWWLALQGSELPQAVFHFLTPHSMAWDQDLVLLDASACQSFWSLKAKQQNLAPVEFLKDLIEEQLGSASPWRVALAHQPWHAILLVKQMQQRNLQGFLQKEEGFGPGVYKQISWDTWWECTDKAAEHQQQLGALKPDTYRRQREQMKRAVIRLGLTNPQQLRTAQSLAVRRRFGSFLGDVWQWTWSESAAIPWVRFKAAEPIRVQRHLDTPLEQWDLIESALVMDLDLLCKTDEPCLHGVVSLEWLVVFHNLSCLRIPIRFRHPHNLLRETSHHRTTTTQALHAFELAVQQATEDLLDDERMSARTVESWTLSVSESLNLPPRIVSLFSDGGNDEEEKLLDLENRLTVPLQSFYSLAEWMPETSFKQGQSPQSHALIPSLMMAGKSRPLFIYQKPRPLLGRPRTPILEFLERTMTPWWQKSPEGRRDYYRSVDRQHKSRWVYQNSQGRWFEYGYFG